MRKLCIFLFLALASTSFAWELRTGTYSLSGMNPNGSTYYGTVVIAPQGDNYNITWYIGDTLTQVGVGIFRNWEDILNVAFADLPKGYWGTVSYKVNAWDELEGVWASSNSSYQGAEVLRWVSAYYPR